MWDKHPAAEPTTDANDVIHSDAHRRLVAEGTMVTDKNILSDTKTQFGQYYGQTFK